jgi:hypothetical protein
MSNLKIKIEKGVNYPRRNELPTMPLGDMEAGDSFFLPVDMTNDRLIQTLRQRVCRYQRVKGGKYSVLKEGEGMRVYRLE